MKVYVKQGENEVIVEGEVSLRSALRAARGLLQGMAPARGIAAGTGFTLETAAGEPVREIEMDF